MMIWPIVIGFAIGIILAFIVKYNSLIRLKNLVKEAWSGIDVQLKRRYDLIPNLVATVKGYSEHEKGVFEEVTKLRTAAMSATTVEERAKAEGNLTGALKSLFAVAEAYPDLKANQNFLDLQKQLANIEDQLQLARRYYNGVVREYNTSIAVFPGNIVASIFHFGKEPFFELSSTAERETPKVKF